MLLEVNNLSVHYITKAGAVQAVDDVSFKIEEGEYFGIVGESGCGKTTIAKSIIKVLPPNCRIVSGELQFKGRNIVSMRKNELNKIRWKEISMIPQTAMNSLDPVYKIGDQIIESIKAHRKIRRGEAVRRVEELFDLVGLDKKRIWDYPHQFSGGMRQRANIAMAVALNPSLIIADESTTALDVIVQDAIMRQIKLIQKKNKKSVLMITHEISLIAENCDKVAIMYAGKFMEHGSVDSVLNHAYHPYTLGLMNACPSLKGLKKQLISIPGSPPTLLNPTDGCRFRERCPFFEDVCIKQPPLIEVGRDHFLACHFPDRADEFREKAKSADTWLGKREVKM